MIYMVIGMLFAIVYGYLVLMRSLSPILLIIVRRVLGPRLMAIRLLIGLVIVDCNRDTGFLEDIKGSMDIKKHPQNNSQIDYSLKKHSQDFHPTGQNKSKLNYLSLIHGIPRPISFTSISMEIKYIKY